MQLALDGVGIVRLADVIVGEAIRSRGLVALLTDVHKRELVHLSAVYAPGRHPLPKMSAFLDFLVERFSSAPWRQRCRGGEATLSDHRMGVPGRTLAEQRLGRRRSSVLWRKWRATADEDGHYCFAMAL